MNDVQGVALSLLGELDSLFGEAKVPYCLADKMAWDCCRSAGFSGSYYQYGILVPEAAVAAMKSMDWSDGRVVGMGRSFGHGLFSVRYVHAGTTLLCPESANQDAPGIGVELLPVRQDGDVWLAGSGHGKLIELAFDPLKALAFAEFERVAVRVCARADDYLVALLGRSWKSKYGLTLAGPRYGTVASVSDPYAEVVAEARNAGAYDPSIAQVVSDYEQWKRRELSSSRAEVERLTDEYRLVTQRFKMCERYVPCKEKLMRAWKDGRKALVAQALDDYLKQLRYFYERGSALYFDRDIFELALRVLLWQRKRYALKLPFMIPAGHRKEELSAVLAPYLKG